MKHWIIVLLSIIGFVNWTSAKQFTSEINELVDDCAIKGNKKSCENLDLKCKEKNSEACLGMAYYWENIEKDLDIANSFLKRACKLGESSACAKNKTSKTKKAPQNLITKCAKEELLSSCNNLEEYCDSGDNKACVAISIYWFGLGSFETSAEYMKKACDRKDSQACKGYDSILVEQAKNKVRENKKRELEQKISEVEHERDARNAAYQEQSQERQRQQSISTGLMMMSNMINAPPQYLPQNPQPTNCYTRPVTDFTGKIVRYDTVCK